MNLVNQYPAPRQQDASKIVSIALPNAANTVNTNAINLEAVTPFPTTGQFVVQLSNTAGTGANTKNINYALQHTNANSDGTADNGNWANIPELAIVVVVGNAANANAHSENIYLPPTVKQYVRGTATGEANGGNSSDGTMTVSLGF